jgi:hypothetical protein
MKNDIIEAHASLSLSFYSNTTRRGEGDDKVCVRNEAPPLLYS